MTQLHPIFHPSNITPLEPGDTRFALIHVPCRPEFCQPDTEYVEKLAARVNLPMKGLMPRKIRGIIVR